MNAKRKTAKTVTRCIVFAVFSYFNLYLKLNLVKNIKRGCRKSAKMVRTDVKQ